MRKEYCGRSGCEIAPVTHMLKDVALSESVLKAFLTYYGKDLVLRPAQEEALFRNQLLSDSRNVIIATPTNSGKSLLSYMLLFEKAAAGMNVILVEPLRALAYEKTDELKKIADLLKRQSRVKVEIKITTGDYRLNDEFMHSAPVEGEERGVGQIIVATPERLDALSRVPENREWFERCSLVCFDEAHLIGDASRGATLELLIAFLRSLQSNLRIVLMSATISNTEELAAWLDPCMVISDVPRYPTLDKWVYCVEDGEDLNQVLIDEIKEVLDNPDSSVLVFVYQTAAAESLAVSFAASVFGKRIKNHDLTAAVESGVAWFHSKMSAATKESVIHAVYEGKVRLVVSTTALSMGINLPATHVYVRDTIYAGARDLDVSDLMQMIGRAGRGNRKGTGVVLLYKNSLSKEKMIVDGLKNEIVPQVQSRLIPFIREDYYGVPDDDLYYVDRVGNQVMGIINRFGNVTLNKMKSYLGYTLGGDRFEDLPKILRYLCDWKLAYLDENTNEYQLTQLGKTASRCYLPPVTAANFGQLIRDLLSDKSDGSHVANLQAIDFLIILCLVSGENKPISRFSKSMISKVKNYMEALPLEEKSYLFRTWIEKEPAALLGSARMVGNVKKALECVYQCTYTAMMIYDLSRGISHSQLNEYYHTDVEELQEKLRDNAIWILCGFENLLEVKTFYYHLKTECVVEAEEIQKVDDSFGKASKTIFALVANLKFRSPLGEMVRGIKRVFPNAESYPGEASVRKLEENGILKIRDLVGKSASDLVALGIRRDYADLICGYIRNRLA